MYSSIKGNWALWVSSALKKGSWVGGGELLWALLRFSQVQGCYKGFQVWGLRVPGS